ncbi:MAG: Uma2 family endonuclease [Cyanobacteria bacterium J06628_6]
MTYALDKPQHFVHSGLNWLQFKSLKAAFDGSPGVRVSYFNGEIEIVTVSPLHGIVAGNLGFLLELWFLKQGIAFVATEDMTVEEENLASAQGDKSYSFGEQKNIPDLVIEVVITGEGETKLARYAALGVQEVWFWQDNQIRIHQLVGATYQLSKASQFAASLDVNRLATSAVIKNRAEALASFQQSSY